jgi:hypothetical protein
MRHSITYHTFSLCEFLALWPGELADHCALWEEEEGERQIVLLCLLSKLSKVSCEAFAILLPVTSKKNEFEEVHALRNVTMDMGIRHWEKRTYPANNRDPFQTAFQDDVDV